MEAASARMAARDRYGAFGGRLSGILLGRGGAERWGSAYLPGMGGGRGCSKTEFRLEVGSMGW